MAAGRELRHPWGRTAHGRPRRRRSAVTRQPQAQPRSRRRPNRRPADVAHQAAGSAQHVAETAKAEAANVAAEVKTNAKDLLYQAKSDLTDQAGAQQQKVAQGLHSISDELRTMAAASDQRRGQ